MCPRNWVSPELVSPELIVSPELKYCVPGVVLCPRNFPPPMPPDSGHRRVEGIRYCVCGFVDQSTPVAKTAGDKGPASRHVKKRVHSSSAGSRPKNHFWIKWRLAAAEDQSRISWMKFTERSTSKSMSGNANSRSILLSYLIHLTEQLSNKKPFISNRLNLNVIALQWISFENRLAVSINSPSPKLHSSHTN